MTEGIWILALLGIGVGWTVLMDARSRDAMHREHRRREQEDAAEALRIKQQARYTLMRRTKSHLLDRDEWTPSVGRAPSLQKRATLTVLKGAKR